MHPTATFMAEWLKTSLRFLDVIVSFIKGAIETDLHLKPTYSHQYLQPKIAHKISETNSSFHVKQRTTGKV